MKKNLVVLLIIILFMFVACNLVKGSEQVKTALNQTSEDFDSFLEMKDFYDSNIKSENNKYVFIEFNIIPQEHYQREISYISFSGKTGETYNNLYFVNRSYYYDQNLGNYNELNEDGDLPVSLIALVVSYKYSGNIDSNLTFVHNKIKEGEYNKEVNVYLDETCIMTMWYYTKLNIKKMDIENIIIEGIRT